MAKSKTSSKAQKGTSKSSPLASENPSRVLIADDDPMVRKVLERFLGRANHEALIVDDGVAAMEAMSDDIPVALVDLNMPGASGLDVLGFIREEFPDAQVIIVSGEGEIRDAVHAMKAGACDYITKPVSADELLATVEQAIGRSRLSKENRGLRAVVASHIPARDFTAEAKASKQLLKRIHRVAPLDSSVLITGESGTGKSTIARLIHQQSARRDGPFVAVNCASLPRELIESELFGHKKGAFTGAVEDRPGRIEFAGGGTLFLDEIGDMPLELQPKLLTFLQDRTVQRIGCNKTQQVDVRVISATHQDLATMCNEGRFREDLYYRLNVLHLESPALRARPEDILPLSNVVLDRLSARAGRDAPKVSEEAGMALSKYRWPGNIRELENVMERAFAFCTDNLIDLEVLEQHLSTGIVSTTNAAALSQDSACDVSLTGRTLADLERQAIEENLAACEGNKSKTARVLGISQKSIYNKMRRHGLL